MKRMTDPLIVTAVLPHLAHAVGTHVRFRVALYPTPVDDTPLWEDRIGPEPVGAGGTVHLVLGVHQALPVEVFERFPRWLSVSEDGAAAIGPRIPVSGAALRHAARLDAGVASPATAPPGHHHPAADDTATRGRDE